MKTKHPNSGFQMGSLVCVALLACFGASCSVGGDGGTPSVIAIEDSDITPAPRSDSDGPSSESSSSTTPVTSGSSTLESQEVTIAKCLSSKGAVLYGADWCPYTNQQIDSFKDGFQYISYVECTEQGTLCKEKGITGYPTWIVGETRLVGYRSPTSIASSVGCSW